MFRSFLCAFEKERKGEKTPFRSYQSANIIILLTQAFGQKIAVVADTIINIQENAAKNVIRIPKANSSVSMFVQSRWCKGINIRATYRAEALIYTQHRSN